MADIINKTVKLNNNSVEVVIILIVARRSEIHG